MKAQPPSNQLMYSWKTADKAPPAGSVVPKVLRVIWLGIRGGMSLNAAQPAVQQEKYGRQVPWDDEFLKGVRDALIACQIWWVPNL